jgi:hypothetical protein
MSEDMTGRAKGGHARAEALTPEKRREIARKGAAARWHEPVLRATHGSADHPLKIGNIEIPCYVLEDNRRVLSGRGMQTALELGQRHGAQLGRFLGHDNIKPYINKDLAMALEHPIRFTRPGRGGKVAVGYEATVLVDICEAVLVARDAGLLKGSQLVTAQQCEILTRAFAKVGIIALIDEATGYQRDRAADALAKILEAFIAKELQPWVQTFPAEYYAQIFRLRGMEYPRDTVQRPRYFGLLTNDIVYKRLAPGVLEELKRVTPRNESGRAKHKYFQKLTSNVGYPKLREHLGAVVAVMKLSKDWYDFRAKLDNFYPRHGEPVQIAFDYGDGDGGAEEDSGRGL